MKVYVPVLIFFLSVPLYAQKYRSESSSITFFSEATIEDITAANEKASSLFNAGTGEVAYIVPISNFEFDKSLMKQHFNEKYMESDKFPNALFKGKITGYDAGSASLQNVRAEGILTIHGQSKKINVPGTFQFQNGMVRMNSSFIVELADYKIKIPKLLWQNIAERVEVKIDFSYKPQ